MPWTGRGSQPCAPPPDLDFVGLVDLDVELARRATEDKGVLPLAVGASVADVASRAGADAVVSVTVPGALRTGHTPSEEVHSNVSLEMVEAAVRSSSRGTRVLMHDVLEDGLFDGGLAAARDERPVRVLTSWGTVHEGLAR